MIIYIRGTNPSDENKALKAAAFLSSVSYLVFNQKTLVLQIGNNTADVESYINGKADIDDKYAMHEVDLSEVGIDALLLRADTERISRHHFESLVDSTVVGSFHLDIAPKSKTSTIEQTILSNLPAFGSLLKSAAGDRSASAPYDSVILVSGSGAPELTEEMIKRCDHEIICVSQGKAEFKVRSGKDREKIKCKTSILITDFDLASVYTERAIRKLYGIKDVFTLPYNVHLKDAMASGNVLDFVNKNIHPDKMDDNYQLMNAANLVMEFVYKNNKPAHYDLDDVESKNREEEENMLEELPAGSVSIGHYTAKRGMKDVDKISINIDTDNPNNQTSTIVWQEMPKQKGFVSTTPQRGENAKFNTVAESYVEEKDYEEDDEEVTEDIVEDIVEEIGEENEEVVEDEEMIEEENNNDESSDMEQAVEDEVNEIVQEELAEEDEEVIEEELEEMIDPIQEAKINQKREKSGRVFGFLKKKNVQDNAESRTQEDKAEKLEEIIEEIEEADEAGDGEEVDEEIEDGEEIIEELEEAEEIIEDLEDNEEATTEEDLTEDEETEPQYSAVNEIQTTDLTSKMQEIIDADKEEEEEEPEEKPANKKSAADMLVDL